MSNVLVVGSVAYDDVETPYAKREDLLGGSATYFSVSASLYTQPRLVGVVGNDFKQSDRDVLAHHGVDTTGLTTDPRGQTFRWGGRYHANMDQRDTLYTHLNVFADFRPEIPEAYRDTEFVFLGNIDPELQLNVLKQVNRPRLVALDTMNFWIEGKTEALKRVLRKVDCLIINDEEGRMLTGKYSARSVGRALQALGPSTIVLKRGEHGALLFADEDVFYVPAYPLEVVVDATGAGDTFAGGFVGYLARARELTPATLRRAMLTGSIMASFCVEGFGLDKLREVTLDDVRERYEHFLALTRCPELTL